MRTEMLSDDHKHFKERASKKRNLKAKLNNLQNLYLTLWTNQFLVPLLAPINWIHLKIT